VFFQQKLVRNYSLKKFEHCSNDDDLMFIQPDVPEQNLNDIFNAAGSAIVSEKLYGPMDLSYQINRCTSDMKNCEKFLTFNVRNVCQKFQDSLSFIGKAVANITPPMKCPIEVGNYTLKKTEIDLKKYSFLPIDGFILNLVVKLVTTIPSTKTRAVATCVKVEFEVDKIRVRTVN
jgi:hypothetical protein